jgi:predicted  nucleic acid-binding Zn-ribbon protein
VDVEFEKLIGLQRLDSEIRHITLFLEGIPALLEEIRRKIESSSSDVARAKEELAQNQKKRRDREGRVRDLKTQITKYKRQLNEVKTNKEYTALLKEIEETQHSVDAVEEEIISEMLAADDIEERIRAAGQRHKQEEESLLKDQDVLIQKKAEMEAKSKKLTAERDALLPQVPADHVVLYQRISAKKGGVALSPVSGDFCSMCHMRIRPQVLNELRDSKKLILCENCGRILYWLKVAPEQKQK